MERSYHEDWLINDPLRKEKKNMPNFAAPLSPSYIEQGLLTRFVIWQDCYEEETSGWGWGMVTTYTI